MPLPNPNQGENRTDFMARCVIDANIINDFGTIEQRVAVCDSLWEDGHTSKFNKELKSAKDNWQMSFEAKLAQAEKSPTKDSYDYYQSQYEQGIKIFLQQKALQYTDLQGLFLLNDLTDLYYKIYGKIGITFAKWYAKNAEKLIKKFDSADFESAWNTNFRFLASQVAGNRVTGVSGTGKKTLMSVTKRLMSDKDFMVAGEVVQARILRKEFKKYSTFQAKRLVRTESTNAANYATLMSAKDVFAGKDLMKEWIAAMDERTRPAHAEANMGKPIAYNEKFIVGGEMLNHPGDPAGSSGNVINCRCSVATFPKPEAEVIGGDITGILGGIAVGEILDLVAGQ